MCDRPLWHWKSLENCVYFVMLTYVPGSHSIFCQRERGRTSFGCWERVSQVSEKSWLLCNKQKCSESPGWDHFWILRLPLEDWELEFPLNLIQGKSFPAISSTQDSSQFWLLPNFQLLGECLPRSPIYTHKHTHTLFLGGGGASLSDLIGFTAHVHECRVSDEKTRVCFTKFFSWFMATTSL